MLDSAHTQDVTIIYWIVHAGQYNTLASARKDRTLHRLAHAI